MHIIVVDVHLVRVKVVDFKEASLLNAKKSICEHEVLRFAVLHHKSDETRFV